MGLNTIELNFHRGILLQDRQMSHQGDNVHYSTHLPNSHYQSHVIVKFEYVNRYRLYKRQKIVRGHREQRHISQCRGAQTHNLFLLRFICIV